MNILIATAIAIIVIYTAAVGYIGFCVGEERAKKEDEITCDTCVHRDTCQIYQMSDCIWCEEWEEYDGEA